MKRQEFLETIIEFGTKNGTSLEFHESFNHTNNVGLTIRQADDVKLAEKKAGAYIRRDFTCMNISPNSAAVLADLFEQAAPLLRALAANGTIARPEVKDYVENLESNDELGITNTILPQGQQSDGVGNTDL